MNCIGHTLYEEISLQAKRSVPRHRVKRRTAVCNEAVGKSRTLTLYTRCTCRWRPRWRMPKARSTTQRWLTGRSWGWCRRRQASSDSSGSEVASWASWGVFAGHRSGSRTSSTPGRTWRRPTCTRSLWVKKIIYPAKVFLQYFSNDWKF